MNRLALIFILCSLTAKAVTNTVPCDFLSVSNAIATVTEGNTILIEPGICVLSNKITSPTEVFFKLRGSGTNLTTLISASNSFCISLRSSSNGVTSVSDLNCVGHVANSSGFFTTFGAHRFFHFYNLQMTNVLYRGIYPDGGSFGLIDHCYFAIGSSPVSFNPFSAKGNGYTSWSEPNPAGTTNAFYVEDCTFDQTIGSGGNGFFDSYDGAQIVIRHNYFNGGAFNGTHGYDSQPTSARLQEVYCNVFTNWNINSPFTLIRGGGMMVYSNTVYTSGVMASTAVGSQVQYYRAAYGSYGGFYGYCFWDKTNSYTTNFANNVSVSVGGSSTYKFLTSLTGAAGQVLLGADLGDSLTNLSLAVNKDSASSGTKYTSATVKNSDFYPILVSSNQIVYRNRMDGTNQYGYPAAMQPGVIQITQFTNTGVVLYPCYSWSNICVTTSGSNVANIGVRYGGDTNYDPNVTTNIQVSGRDYFNDTIPDPSVYTALVYPHPLQALEVSDTNALSGASISPTAATHVLGQAADTFTASITTGVPEFYQWSINGADVSGANSSIYAPAFDVAGIYEVNFWASNSFGPNLTNSVPATNIITTPGPLPLRRFGGRGRIGQ